MSLCRKFYPVGIAASIATVPLLKKGLEHLQRGEIKLDGFLGAGCVTAIAAGEVLTALEILWISRGLPSE